MSTIILKSSSPRRKAILSQVGYQVIVDPSEVDESQVMMRSPAQYVQDLALVKLGNTFDQELLYLAADTVVAIDDQILGKPSNQAEAFKMLSCLNGRTHRVYTGVAIHYLASTIVFYAVTEVTFYPLSDREIKDYLTSGEADGKAGAYAIQGRAALFIQSLSGDYYNVMGLPIGMVHQKIQQLLLNKAQKVDINN